MGEEGSVGSVTSLGDAIAETPSDRADVDDRASSRAHDPRLRTMVADHFDRVWRTLLRLGVPASGVDDAAQQVFLVASRKLAAIEPRGEKQYLLGIAVRVASDARRGVSRRREVDIDHAAERIDPLPSPEELVDRKRARELLETIVATMPLELRVVFTLFELEQLSAPEAAAVLGIPSGTVASRLRRAREHFRAELRRVTSRSGISGEGHA